jgi:glycosyltransferase involved in cell wall biosynthesis
VDSLDPGGAERVAVDLCNHLARRGIPAALCATRRTGALERQLKDVPFFSLGRGRRWDVRGMLTFGRELRRRDVGLVHSHGRSTMQFVSLARSLGLARVPHVFHDHAGAGARSTPGAGLRWAARLGVSAYVAVDDDLAQWAVQSLGVAPATVTVQRNAVDLDRFARATPVDVRAELALADADVVIAMVAHIHPRKNHALVLHAMASLPPEVRAGLVLLGDVAAEHRDYRRGLERLVDERGLSGVRFVTGRSDIPEVLLGCDIGVLSSSAESGPLAVLEYMAAGLPFVATRVGQVTRDLALTDAGGIVVEAGDAEGFAAALRRVVAMPASARAAMGAAGRRVVADQFSIDANVDEVEALYRRLAAGSVSSER